MIMDKKVAVMATLPTQFKQAKQNVEPPEADIQNASRTHSEVRELLESNSTLLGYAISTILIGSYSRSVSIKRVKDVDVLSKLPDVPDDIDAISLLDTFMTVLREGFGKKRVERQDRSVKVLFPSMDLHVDVVPARPKGDHWEIPNRTDRGGGWEETNPERLGELSSEMNEKHNDLYVPVVKLIRQTRQANLEDQPGGLYFEVLTFHAYDNLTKVPSSLTTAFCSALEGVSAQLRLAVEDGTADPTLPGKTISTRATDDDLQMALKVFADLSLKAQEALADDDRCRAAKIFREILGKNSDEEYVFPMPEDCSEDGTKLAAPAIVAWDKHVPEGNHRFACLNGN